VAAQGPPLQPTAATGRAALVVPVSRAEDLPAAVERVRAAGLDVHVDEPARRLTAPAQGLGDITRIAGLFEGSGIDLDDLGLQRPSLDDVFLSLTGHRAEESAERETEEVRA